MLLNPKDIFEEKLLKGIEGYPTFDPDKQIQQAGIDIRVARIFTVHSPIIEISETTKPDFKSLYGELEPDSQGWFHLLPGTAYSIDSMEFIKVPENASAFVLQRSTFNRSGVFITGSVYDPSFEGNVGATMYVFNRLKLQVGTRIAQVFFALTDSAGNYNGSYQGQKGHIEKG